MLECAPPFSTIDMRADDVLLDRVPGALRSGIECALVVGLVFLPTLVSSATRSPGALPRLAGAELAWIVGRWLVVMAAVAVILAADGQSARHLGLGPARLGRELAWGAPALAGAFAVHLLVTVPVALVMHLTGTAG